jgi:hypothetical protein
VIERTLQELGSSPVRDFQSLYDADLLARTHAAQAVAALG